MSDPSPDVLAWLEKLVSFDTTSSRSNRGLIEAVAGEMSRIGLDPLVLPTEDGTKANLVVTVPDVRGNIHGGVMLSGHTDVVPTDGQPWSSDPYTLTARAGRLYGRGTSDMKGFDAVALAALEALGAADLREPLHLALTYDEEVGCLGAPPLVEALRDRGRMPAVCFVGEPTSLRMIRGHKAISVVTVEVSGRAAHSSLTNAGVNAIEGAASVIDYWTRRCGEWRTQGPFDEAYPLPYTTGAVTTVAGGNGVNIIPATCRLTLEFRAIAGVDPAAEVEALREYCATIDQALRSQAGEHADAVGVEVVVNAATPGLDTPPDGPAVVLGSSLGLAVSGQKVTYGTEAGVFAASGISTVVCGPGDIARAHTADEYIEPGELADCEEFMGRLIAHLRLD